MFRLLCVVSMLMLILIIGLVAIIGLTYRNTNRFAYLFNHPDGTRCETPCLFGIDPVVMSLEQMDKILSITPALQQAAREKVPTTVTYRGNGLIVNAFHHSQIVPYAEVQFASDFPTLGDLLVVMGKPERIDLFRPLQHPDAPPSICGTFVFYAHNQTIVLYGISETECMNRYQKISRVNVQPAYPDNLKISVVWQGFISDVGYESLLTQARQNP